MPAKRPPSLPGRTTQHVFLKDALPIAIRLHQEGQLEPARKMYERILEAAPGDANAVHFLGVLHHQMGHSDQAAAYIKRSIELDPTVPGWYNNLGNVLLESRRLAEAADAYEKAAAMSPRDATLLNNLGALRRAQERHADAEAAYRQAMALDPKLPEAHNNLGNLYRSMGRTQDALAHYCEALILNPKQHQARKMLGIAYYTLRRFDEAAKVYREWLAEEPDNPVPKHYLAGCTGEAVPARAADAYVEITFDAFAESFDANLENLTYRAPQYVASAVERLCGEAAGTLHVLDAGCGTGLCGPLITGYAKRLVGVDLSAKMLAKARPRQVYDELVKAELTTYLQSVNQGFDLVISADTLCYFGELESALQAAHGALRSGGWLVFTLERLDTDAPDQRSRLNPHGRYSHSRAYVENVLTQAGFDHVAADAVHLRNEGGVPVQGWLMSARRP
ncbi:tetratricopeptide repeat protein [Ramlibacter sp. WS9]|uniref:tetratricopeptide repeat protein n=1 Tax=Ramlibacter sp. WS9 TaxID=1882741 RepID=UPI0011432142|nr:tetratricopeptide repeat protein [Ramlibacter sp. WS9]ROZ78326.1 tetratricopeptide repeat protein [Ramlibacter sp. WS9]